MKNSSKLGSMLSMLVAMPEAEQTRCKFIRVEEKDGILFVGLIFKLNEGVDQSAFEKRIVERKIQSRFKIGTIWTANVPVNELLWLAEQEEIRYIEDPQRLHQIG